MNSVNPTARSRAGLGEGGARGGPADAGQDASDQLPVLLARPQAYPGRHESVEVRETHISWVFLVGRRAYKLKKPLVLPFLDYSTASRRREVCHEEVRLNRRLAPELYLGVRGVVPTSEGVALANEDDPRAVDYVVEMRRYDERDTVSARLDRGELMRSEIDRVARRLARFHGSCQRDGGGERGSVRIGGEVRRNVAELLELVEQRRERARVRLLGGFMASFVAAHRAELDARAARGTIRECHGDLRAEHVLLRPRVRVVDCVEFDRDLRMLDVADDLAFLAMDLAALGGERFAVELVEAYRGAGGDCGEDALVAFFAAHRALVRAKVLLVRASQRPPGSAAHGHASAQARDLIGVAERFSWHARLPLLIVVCGVPASGKTTLARALADRARLPYLSSDATRKRLAGIPSRRHAPLKVYSAEWNARTYAGLGRAAAREFQSQRGVVVDGTFRHRADRDAFMQAFGAGTPTVYVECRAPSSVLAARAAGRRHEQGQISDAGPEVVMRERSSWEPLDEPSTAAHVRVRTDLAIDETVDEVMLELDQRTTAGAPTSPRAAADAAEIYV